MKGYIKVDENGVITEAVIVTREEMTDAILGDPAAYTKVAEKFIDRLAVGMVFKDGKLLEPEGNEGA